MRRQGSIGRENDRTNRVRKIERKVNPLGNEKWSVSLQNNSGRKNNRDRICTTFTIILTPLREKSNVKITRFLSAKLDVLLAKKFARPSFQSYLAITNVSKVGLSWGVRFGNRHTIP